MDSSIARQLPVLRSLDDDARRRIYQVLRDAGRPLTRREVAAAADLPLRLTTFHLERLLDAGLLTSAYARPPGRSGPGAGRSAKYYEPAAVELEVSIPQRRYALVGSLLVDALSAAQRGEAAYDAALRVARNRGQAIARQAATIPRRGRAGERQLPASLAAVLRRLGYEPYEPAAGTVALRNCPFNTLAEQAPDLVCALNRTFLQGVLEGLGDPNGKALLASCRPGDCCVVLQPAS